MSAKFLLTLAVVLGLSAACMAGPELSVKLVRVSSDRGSDGIKGVLDALKKSLVSGEYNLVASDTTALPAGGRTMQLGEYRVVCKGGQKNLAVKVLYGRRELMNSALSLEDGKPFVFAGLPSEKGARLMLIFLVP